MNLSKTRTTGILAVCVVAVGATSGCISINSPSNEPSVTVAPPTVLPTIPVDTSKSFDEQVNEIKRAYCKVRNTPAADAVADAVGAALFAAVALPGSGGLLRPEKLGPDGPVFASRVLQAIMAVEGVAALEGLSFDGSAFAEVARIPAAGAYFDFAGGGVRINGRLAG